MILHVRGPRNIRGFIINPEKSSPDQKAGDFLWGGIIMAPKTNRHRTREWLAASHRSFHWWCNWADPPSTWKWTPGKGDSYWKPSFLGITIIPMLILGMVSVFYHLTFPPQVTSLLQHNRSKAQWNACNYLPGVGVFHHGKKKTSEKPQRLGGIQTQNAKNMDINGIFTYYTWIFCHVYGIRCRC